MITNNHVRENTVNMAWGGRKEQENNPGQKVESLMYFEFISYRQPNLLGCK